MHNEITNIETLPFFFASQLGVKDTLTDKPLFFSSTLSKLQPPFVAPSAQPPFMASLPSNPKMESEQSDVLDSNTDQKATSEESNSSSCGDPNMSYENNPVEIFKNLHRQDVGRSQTTTQLGMSTDGDSEKDDEAGSIDVGEMIETSNAQKKFLHGKHVAAVSDLSGQIGVVTDVNIIVDLLGHHGSVKTDIPSTYLKRITDFEYGDNVVSGCCLGTINDVKQDVTVQLDDGSVCKVMRPNTFRLSPADNNEWEKKGMYYPGQRVQAYHSSVFKDSPWLCGSWKDNQIQGTVSEVTVGQMSVVWVAHAVQGPILTSTTIYEPSLKYVKHLSCLAHTKWEVGDLCLLESSKGSVKTEGEHESSVTGDDSDAKMATEVFLISNVRTTVDVCWQDGIVQRGLDSTSLLIVDTHTLGAHEFFAEQHVVKKHTETGRFGVIKSVDTKERTACVRWLMKSDSGEEEIVSVYELEANPEYELYYGDVVVLQPDRYSEQLEWVGNITNMKDGNVEVTWANGSKSMVCHEDIYVPGEFDGLNDEDFLGTSDEDSNGAVGSGTSEDDICVDSEGISDHNCGTSEDVTKDHAIENLVDSAPEIEDLAKPTSRCDGEEEEAPEVSDFLQTTEDHGIENLVDNAHEIEDLAKLTSRCDGEEQVGGEVSDFLQTTEMCNLKPPIPNASETFQVLVSVPLDHHFFGSQNQNANQKWLKKVQLDWGIFQNYLPEGIYVQAYEYRMDLMRAVIVGAYGTPYHDGLFFFDLHLPPTYPNDPPSVHYHSGGWRLNPNLYENGHICLSLLNTWTGKGKEVWDRSSSTILQVLISLQGLVLNSKPYFNEHGYDQQVGSVLGEKNSEFYNENVFLLNCKMMVHLMRSPLKGFEAMISNHFVARGPHIIKACNAYMGDSLIGSLDASANVSTLTKSNSLGFKKALSNVLPLLKSAMSDLGADLGDLVADLGLGSC